MYGVNFWMPTIIQELGIAKNNFLKVGLVTMIPWGVAGVAMVWYGAHSDRTGERRWHASGALLLTAAGLALLAVAGHAAVMSVVALTLIASGVLGFLVTFWAVPTALLRASAAAAGIAWINSVGNLGGHFGPDLIGRIREATDAATDAFWALALIAVSGALMMLMATTRVRT